MVAGARADLGQLEQALAVLSSPQPDPARTGQTAARLCYAYAEALLALDRNDEALQWFLKAAEADSRRRHRRRRPDRRAVPDVTTFVQEYDCLLLDLDGTVFRGHEPTEGAVAALADAGIRKLFVTNNASRSADEVAAHLCELGFSAGADDVVTSAQSAAHLLAQQVPAGSTVLVVGTDSLADEIERGRTAAGPASSSDQPVAVVQGHSPDNRLGGSGRGGAGDPRGCTLGRRQRRQDAALGTRTAAR